MAVKIVTDSISDISAEVAEVYDIEVLPIEYHIGEEYISANALDISTMINWIRQNQRTPELRGVSVETYKKVFQKYTDQGMEVVCFTAGNMTVSNYSCAMHASTLIKGNIVVIDSHQISTSIGIMAIIAASMAKEGESANAIAIKFERIISKFRQFGLAESVEFLEYSGHCPRIVAFGSNLLNAKFEFSVFNDQKFDVKYIGNNMSKAMNTYFKDVFKNISSIDAKKIFMIHTFSDEDYFAEIYKKVLDLNYFEDIVVCNASLHTTSLYGSNGISIAYMLK